MLHALKRLAFALARTRLFVELMISRAAQLLGTHALAKVRALDVVGVDFLALGVVGPLALTLTLGVIEHAHE